MAKSLFPFMLNQYFRPFLFMVMKCHQFSDRHQTAKLLLFPQSLSANFHSTEKTACLENLICANTVMLELQQKNDRKGISCFSKPTSLSRWVPPLPAGFPFLFILCFLRAHLTDGLPALVCNYSTSTRATSFHKLKGLNRWVDANEQVRTFCHMRIQARIFKQMTCVTANAVWLFHITCFILKSSYNVSHGVLHQKHFILNDHLHPLLDPWQLNMSSCNYIFMTNTQRTVHHIWL